MPHDFNYNEGAAIEEEKKQGAETFSFMGRFLAFTLGVIALLAMGLVGSFLIFCIHALWRATQN